LSHAGAKERALTDLLLPAYYKPEILSRAVGVIPTLS